jgi:hypothetical protein
MPLNDRTIDSLSHQKKKQILCNDADAHRKQRESLPPEQKVKFLEIDADAYKNNESLFHLKIKTYLKRIILLHNTNITTHSHLMRKLKY